LQMPYRLYLGKQTPDKTLLYGASRMSVVEPVLYETCKVGIRPLQSNYATDINEYTREGNSERINVHILLCVLIVQSYYA
jgi:hypothetical protein